MIDEPVAWWLERLVYLSTLIKATLDQSSVRAKYTVNLSATFVRMVKIKYNVDLNFTSLRLSF